MRRTVVAMTPMTVRPVDQYASTSTWPGRGVGDDDSNGPFDDLEDHGTNDPTNCTTDAARCIQAY